MHPLVATEGEVTILRKLAACSYGTWKVDWPESVPDENRPVIDDDREFGYVSRPSVEPSRMGRRFVRADVSITAAEYDGSGVVPYSGYSDVESTLDNAYKRTDGDVFLEREITRAGLGRLEPYVDFEVGDVVPVLIWDRVVDLVVRQIEAVTELGAVVNWRVYVGGELVEDSAERERANLELQRQIAEERRERLRDLGAVESRVSAAVAAEREARVEALKAEAAEREKLAGDLGNAVTTADFEQYDAALQEDLWTRQQAFNELSSDFQVEQERINEQQVKINEQQIQLNAQQTEIDNEQNARASDNENMIKLLTEAQNASFEQIRQMQESMTSPSTGSVVIPINRQYPESEYRYFEVTGSPGSWWLSNTRKMTGNILFEVYKGDPYSGGLYFSSVESATFVTPVYKNEMRNIKISENDRWARITWTIPARKLYTRDERSYNFTPGMSAWAALPDTEFTATEESEYTIRLAVTWNAAAHNPTYGMRWTVNGSPVQTKTDTGVGPLTPFGNGRIPWSITSSRVNLKPGDVVRFEVYCSSSVASQRNVYEFQRNVSWVGDM